MFEIQNVAFNKDHYNLKSSLLLLIDYGETPIKKPHVTENWIRYRIKEPSLFKKNSFRSKKIYNDNIIITYGELKKNKIFRFY